MGVLIELLINKMRRETLGNLIHISEPGAVTVTVVYTRRIGRV